MTAELPILGITMGDPAGIGPEIILKAAGRGDLHGLCRPLVIGDAGVLELSSCRLGIGTPVRAVTGVRDAVFEVGTVDVFDLRNMSEDLVFGKISPAAGRAAYEAIVRAIELALSGEIDGTVTAPIHKKALNEAGVGYAGHTEIYADLTETRDYAMMLVHEGFRVVHVCTHVALRDVPDCITFDRVLRVIRLAHETGPSIGIESPSIGVSGLNPHAGDEGLFGREEIEVIGPAVSAAVAEGIDAIGPEPPDTVFARGLRGAFDFVVAMYHDQGHIPVKLAGFVWDEGKGGWSSVSGINVTLGLPIIRTSVDHGVAFDIAGKGVADPTSLINAVKMAARMTCN